MYTKKYFHIILCFFCLSFLLAACQSHQIKWGTISSPDKKFQVTLYQKERDMHQAPEILVSFHNKDDGPAQMVGSILLPEDNRNQLQYKYEWHNNKLLKLTIACDYCMIDERHYIIDFNKKQPKIDTIKQMIITRK